MPAYRHAMRDAQRIVCGQRWRGLLLVSTAIVSANALSSRQVLAQTTSGAPAQAATGQFTFNIPSQSLSSAMIAFQGITGMSILADGSVPQKAISPGVSGALSADSALQQMLAGTGLSYSFSGSTARIFDPSANDSGATVDGAIALDTIDVSGGGNDAGVAADAPYQTPGSSAYISRGDIEQFPGTSPGDVFKSTAGVLVGEARNSGAIDVNIRGLQGYGRTTVTIDGAQQQSNVDRGYFGDANRTFIDPDLLSGIAITKGPSNDPSSSGAIAGTVAMTTLTADDVVKPGETWGLRIRGGLNGNSSSPPPVGTQGGIEVPNQIFTRSNIPGWSNDTIPNFVDVPATGRPDWFEPTGRTGSVALATKQENFELLAAMAYRENGNYYAGTNGNYARIGKSSGRETFIADQDTIDYLDAIHPGHTIHLGDELYIERASFNNVGLTDYRAGEEVFNTSYQTSSALLKGNFRIDDESTLELAYMRNKSQFGFLWPSAYKFLQRPEQTPLSLATVDTLTGKYKYHPTDSDLINVSLNTWFTRQQFDESQTYSFLNYTDHVGSNAMLGGFDLSNVSRLSGALDGVTLLYGLAYLHERADTDRFHEWETPGGGDYWATFNGHRQQWDAFANLTWKPADWLTAEAGARYITVTNGLRSSMIFVDGAFPPTSITPNDRTQDGLVPNTSLTLEPLKGLQLYGAYKEGMRVASFIENRDFGNSGINSGMEDLKPERSHTYEAGVNVLADGLLAASDKLGLKANYFINSIDDYIMMFYNYQNDDLTTVNYDRARFSGIELSGMYDGGMLFASGSAIFYDKVELCPTPVACYSSKSADGIPLNDWRNHVPPKVSVSATAGVRLFDQKLTLAGRVNYTGERAGMPTVFNGDSPHWEPYRTYDVFGSYKFDNDFTFEFSGENITDVYYVDALATAMQPAPGRTLRVNLTKQF